MAQLWFMYWFAECEIAIAGFKYVLTNTIVSQTQTDSYTLEYLFVLIFFCLDSFYLARVRKINPSRLYHLLTFFRPVSFVLLKSARPTPLQFTIHPIPLYLILSDPP